MNEVIKYQWQEQELTLTKSDIRNLISTDPNVTDKEIELFMQLCRYQQLNPFVREAYLIKYGSYPASMVVGKEVFTKRAENNPNFDGYDITDNYKADMDLKDFEVACKVHRKNLKIPISVTVSYSEYVGTDSKGNINRMWAGKPRTMLRKVALMQCLREAFPTALGGLYEETELDQQTAPKNITPKQEAEEVKEIINEVFPADEGVLLPEEVKAVEKADPKFKPASDKQLNYIYGIEDKKGIIESEYMTEKEVERIGKREQMDSAKATKILAWWWGDAKKNIIGEREKREKNPKVGDSEFERRGVLMQEVLGLITENHIKPDEVKKLYKKYQKDEIIQLAMEELQEIKDILKDYKPDWS